jgi:hypothetical protein
VGFGDKILFGQSEVLEGVRVVLAKSYIHVILGREFRNRSSKESGMTYRAEIPETITATAAIEKSFQWA